MRTAGGMRMRTNGSSLGAIPESHAGHGQELGCDAPPLWRQPRSRARPTNRAAHGHRRHLTHDRRVVQWPRWVPLAAGTPRCRQSGQDQAAPDAARPDSAASSTVTSNGVHRGPTCSHRTLMRHPCRSGAPTRCSVPSGSTTPNSRSPYSVSCGSPKAALDARGRLLGMQGVCVGDVQVHHSPADLRIMFGSLAQVQRHPTALDEAVSRVARAGTSLKTQPAVPIERRV